MGDTLQWGAVRAISSIKRDESRAAIVAGLASYLNRDQLNEILRGSRAQTDEQERFETLSMLKPQSLEEQVLPWKMKLTQQLVMLDSSSKKEGMSLIAKSLPTVMDQHHVRDIRQLMTDLLGSFQYSSRQEIFRYYFVKDLFAPPIFSPETLNMIALHIVEICEKWHWL